MHRRTFLTWCGVTSVTLYASVPLLPLQRRFDSVAPVLSMMLRHMYPPAAFGDNALLGFMRDTIFHPSYDRDIRLFVIEGAETFRRDYPLFEHASPEEKERLLRAYEATRYGAAWLSRITVLALEGLLAAPIYGANPDGCHWKMLHTEGGLPLPATRYIWG